MRAWSFESSLEACLITWSTFSSVLITWFVVVNGRVYKHIRSATPIYRSCVVCGIKTLVKSPSQVEVQGILQWLPLVGHWLCKQREQWCCIKALRHVHFYYYCMSTWPIQEPQFTHHLSRETWGKKPKWNLLRISMTMTWIISSHKSQKRDQASLAN